MHCRIELLEGQWVCHGHEEAFISLEAAIEHYLEHNPEFRTKGNTVS